jgi:hypothetical protein
MTVKLNSSISYTDKQEERILLAYHLECPARMHYFCLTSACDHSMLRRWHQWSNFVVPDSFHE